METDGLGKMTYKRKHVKQDLKERGGNEDNTTGTGRKDFERGGTVWI